MRVSLASLILVLAAQFIPAVARANPATNILALKCPIPLGIGIAGVDFFAERTLGGMLISVQESEQIVTTRNHHLVDNSTGMRFTVSRPLVAALTLESFSRLPGPDLDLDEGQRLVRQGAHL